MPVKVLIGFAEALAAPEVAWSLVDAGFEVVAFARANRRAALRHSRFVPVHPVTAPESDLAATRNDLRRVLGRLESASPETRLVYLPLDDTALYLAGDFEANSRWICLAPRRPAVDLALDKWTQIQFARAAGLAVPESRLVTSIDDGRRGSTDYPVIVKASRVVNECAGRVAKAPHAICANRVEFDRAIHAGAAYQPLIVQKFTPGIGEGVFGLATPSGILAWSAHRRVRMMNPHGSGSSACVSRPVPDDIKAAIERLVMSAGWRGLFMIEMLRDATGQAWFIEFNGRTWGSMALSRRQGFEYPAWAVRHALDPEGQLPPIPAHPPTVVCRNLGRELMHLLFVLKGPKSAALAAWPPLRRALAEVCRVERHDRLYNYRRDDLAVFVADTLYTIWDNALKRRRHA